jgi:hypothetical protein
MVLGSFAVYGVLFFLPALWIHPLLAAAIWIMGPWVLRDTCNYLASWRLPADEADPDPLPVPPVRLEATRLTPVRSLQRSTEPALRPSDLRILETSDDIDGHCAYCSAHLEDRGPQDAVLVCSTCRTPHHRSCWRESRTCATYACGGRTARAA